MSDQTRILAGITLGAFVGGMVTYLVFTPHGRHTLARVNPTLDDLSHALKECRLAIRQAEGVKREARGAMEDVRTVLAGVDLTAE